MRPGHRTQLELEAEGIQWACVTVWASLLGTPSPAKHYFGSESGQDPCCTVAERLKAEVREHEAE